MYGLRSLNAKQGYVMSKFRESRDGQGNLSYISGVNRLQLHKGMNIYNTKSQKIEKIR